MNPLEARALYNLLRMTWLQDSSVNVESWQVEDYRQLSLNELFNRLKQLDIQLDKTSFVAHAEECNSPEEFTEVLVGDQQIKAETEDRIYLLVFELWRRLMSEKPSLSIFCDELDHQIYLYDHGKLEDPIALQDAIANLLIVLDDNVDEGMNPQEVFKLICERCANDLETFLYDFIAEQIETENESYAYELLDDFYPYLKDNKWFLLLRGKLFSHSNVKTAQKILLQIIENHLEEQDIEFNLEVLALVAELGTPALFHQVIKQTTSLLETEEDFQDLMAICVDYYHRLDQEEQERVLQQILEHRSRRSLKDLLDPKDPDLLTFSKVLD